jgi:hypothetical protein
MSIELRPIEYHSGKAYEVLLDGVSIGTVRHCFPTFERGPRQATWVTKRWKAKKPYWEFLEPGKHSGGGWSHETRKRAVEQLVRRTAQAVDAPKGA